MKIQLALDRIDIENAKKIARKAAAYVDIIEVGTSLIKDFGICSVREIKKEFPNKLILADVKTIDEGAYEFTSAFRNGADIATVMGAASINTLKACYETAESFNKYMMIDLLEVENKKINKLREFKDAIFCIHASSDDESGNLKALIKGFKEKFPEIGNIAIAGGVNYETMDIMNQVGISIVIIGKAITRSKSIESSAKRFREMV